MYTGSSLSKISWLIVFGLFLFSPVYADDHISNKNQTELRNKVIQVLNLKLQVSKSDDQTADNEIHVWQSKVASLIHSKKLIKARNSLDFDAPKGEWQFFSRYNLAIAFVKVKQYDNAIDQLNEILKVDVKSPAVGVLHDRANFVLGLAYLKTQLPQKAQLAFNKIKLHSPEANKLLLDIGRAWYQQGDYEKALIAWLALFKRESIDPDVQRALTAVPLTLAKMGRRQQALDYYSKANARYDASLAGLDRTIDQLRKGELLATLQSLIVADSDQQKDLATFQSLPLIDSVGTPYLYALFSTPSFAKQLRFYREFHFYQHALKDMDKTLTLLGKDLKQQHQKRLTFGKDLTKKEINTELAALQKTITTRSKELARVSVNKGTKKQEAKILNKLDKAEARVSTLQQRLALPAGKKMKSMAEINRQISLNKKDRDTIKILLPKVKQTIVELEKTMVSTALDELERQRLALTGWQQYSRLAQARLADEIKMTDLTLQTNLNNNK